MRPKNGFRFDIILAPIVLLSAFLNIFNIWKEQYSNAYYTAAVTSMLQSFHNFFFASFDPAGFVTVDKPPVAFWVQTVFAYVFGVHGWSVILPQALAGIGSVLMVYILVKPTFGKTAARIASLVMACSPIAVAVSRTNNIDSLLVFALLLASWLLFKGIKRGKISLVLAAFAMIGVGFNIKMLQAYLVVPAFYLLYLLAFKGPWKKKLAGLIAATVIMTGISLSWGVVVDLIPPENRPYIGSSQTNSVLELAFGYNGLSRLTGMNRGGGPGGAAPNRQPINQDGPNVSGQQPTRPGVNTVLTPAQGTDNGTAVPNPQQMQPNGSNMPPGALRPDGSGRQGQMGGFAGGGPQGRGGAFGTGQPGPLRLFQRELSGQISWLLPFVALAGAGLLSGLRRKEPLSDKQLESLFWLGWLVPGMVFFSAARFFHHYYLIMLAPPIAALAGAGWVELWNLYREKEGWKTWLLPSGLLITTLFELYILRPYQQQIGAGWTIGIGSAGIGLALVLFVGAKKERLTALAATAGMLVLLIAPLYWSATPLLYGDNGMLPQAGPGQTGFGPRQGVGGRNMDSGINTRLLDYVTKNNTGEKYLFAVPNASSAQNYIIQTGKAVMAMGGFSGSDPILTVEKLEKMVANKEIKYFLISSGSGFGGGGSSVLAWIRAHGTEVPREEWQGNGFFDGPRGMGDANTLYRVDP
ncbi:MAG: glycosyltransferase family 39 protein [Peptococcaceae bacterium]|nr:glycosyltransferase family 39 protein [Peptococcaceae bacterium]MDH7523944.1 glycosyltransferase family 39 protein [Peptococcaceae bacterium]